VPIPEKERRRLYRKLRKWLKVGKAWEMTQELSLSFASLYVDIGN
jgi:hypothetical protein